MADHDQPSQPAESNSKTTVPQGFAALKALQDTDQTTASTAEGEHEIVRSTPPQVREKKIDAFGRACGVGKRKSAVARVWLKPGKGVMTVNGRDVNQYFASPVREMVIAQPFVATNTVGHFDIRCTVRGGGLSGQAGAVRHGIARALQAFEPAYREQMKPLGLLTRDARKVERKKFGRRKARRAFQFSKR